MSPPTSIYPTTTSTVQEVSNHLTEQQEFDLTFLATTTFFNNNSAVPSIIEKEENHDHHATRELGNQSSSSVFIPVIENHSIKVHHLHPGWPTSTVVAAATTTTTTTEDENKTIIIDASPSQTAFIVVSEEINKNETKETLFGATARGSNNVNGKYDVADLQHQQKHNSVSSLSLFLPGITDRRKSGFVPMTGDCDMTRINSDDISTEMGSESQACSSSVGSRCDIHIPAVVNEEEKSRFALFVSDTAMGCAFPESDSFDMQFCDYGEATTKHTNQYSSSNDEDSTPENRFLQTLNLAASLDAQQSDKGTDSCIQNIMTPVESLLIPCIRNVRQVGESDNEEVQTLSRRGLAIPGSGGGASSSGVGGGLTIPGLFNIQSAPSEPTTGFLPWRIKYVPSNSSCIPSHECLTDDTTADGCQDYDEDEDDDEEDYNNTLELPPGVLKKIHEYEKFDWEAELYEAELFITPLNVQKDDSKDDGINDSANSNSDNEDGVKADTSSLFIPLIGSANAMLEDLNGSSGSSDLSEDSPIACSAFGRPDADTTYLSPQTHRNSDNKTAPEASGSACTDSCNASSSTASLHKSSSFTTEYQRSFSRNSVNGRRTVKSRDCTPHPIRQTSRTSASCSCIMGGSPCHHHFTESVSGGSTRRSSTQSPFFPYAGDRFPVEFMNEISNTEKKNSRNNPEKAQRQQPQLAVVERPDDPRIHVDVMPQTGNVHNILLPLVTDHVPTVSASCSESINSENKIFSQNLRDVLPKSQHACDVSELLYLDSPDGMSPYLNTNTKISTSLLHRQLSLEFTQSESADIDEKAEFYTRQPCSERTFFVDSQENLSFCKAPEATVSISNVFNSFPRPDADTGGHLPSPKDMSHTQHLSSLRHKSVFSLAIPIPSLDQHQNRVSPETNVSPSSTSWEIDTPSSASKSSSPPSFSHKLKKFKCNTNHVSHSLSALSQPSPIVDNLSSPIVDNLSSPMDALSTVSCPGRLLSSVVSNSSQTSKIH